MYKTRIEWLRQTKSHMTIKKLAEKLDISELEYTQIEKGELIPTTETLVKLSNLFEESIDFIIERENHTNKLKGLYRDLLKYKSNIEEYTELIKLNQIMINNNKITNNSLHDVLVKSRNTLEKIYDEILRSYILNFIKIPNSNPYTDDILSHLFPIHFEAKKRGYMIHIEAYDRKDRCFMIWQKFYESEKYKATTLTDSLNRKSRELVFFENISAKSHE